MKRAEQLAWGALAGLLVIFAILLTAAIVFNFTAFWAGAMLAGAQAVAVGLAGWGLALARQARELNELPPLPAGEQGFRMSGEMPAEGGRMRVGMQTERGVFAPDQEPETKTIDTSFQRLLVGTTGTLLMVVGGISAYLVYRAVAWGRLNPGEPWPIVGSFNPPANTPDELKYLSEAGLLVGLSMALGYAILYWVTRPRRETGVHGEAVASNFTLGLTPMVMLAVGTVLAYFRVPAASEVAAGVMAGFLILQGMELIVNAFRSYSSIEELDQDAIDLQATPLGPMLSSLWLAGLRMLLAQSVGLTGGQAGERGVIARIMPRSLAAVAVIGIVASCFRVVPAGQVAVLERLGAAPTHAIGNNGGMQMLEKGAILQPGLHFCFPWPIDELVMIPNEQLQVTNVGTVLHQSKGVDFEFWTVRSDAGADTDTEDLFVTGDRSATGEPAPQILETYVQVRWRVERPELFYSVLSHSDFFEKASKETKTLPVYEAIVQQCTSFAVTRTFAIHSLDQVMVEDRKEVESHCKEILQEKLDGLGKSLGLESSGIKIDYLTIKDLHPPYWRPDRSDPTELPIGGQLGFTDNGIVSSETQGSRMKRGPASAFEFVVSMSEYKDLIIAMAEADRTARLNEAQGFAGSEINNAKAYSAEKVARAHGEADRLVKMTENMKPEDQKYQLRLMEQRQLYATLKDLLEPVNKIVVDPDVKDVSIWQATEKGVVPVAPGGR